MISSCPSSRRTHARESFKSAAECIGPVTIGMSLFAITRGQFSMIDAILHVLAEVGPAHIAIWTWAIADHDIDMIAIAHREGRILSAVLMADRGAVIIDDDFHGQRKHQHRYDRWRSMFGPDSVRWVRSHAKMVLVETDRYKILLRGSMNLNYNERFEQLDITEGGPEFDLVKRIQDELPVLSDDATVGDARRACQLGDTPDLTHPMFAGIRTWTPR